MTGFGSHYTIKSVKRNGKTWDYVCEDRTSYSSTFAEASLKYAHTEPESLKPLSLAELPKECPVCQSLWTKTCYGATIWIDCIPCKKTAEKIMDEEKNKAAVKTTASGYPYYQR